MNFEQFVNRYQKRPVVEYENNVLQAVPNPLVTARVSTYNHIGYIAECLKGMLMQKTSFPFEICIGEDESNDGTRELCIEYAQKYPERIRLFLHNRENNIQIDGRPTGRFQSRYTSYMGRGKYEAICEGDDYWTDSIKLQKQVDFLEAHPQCALCYHKVSNVYEDGSHPVHHFPVTVRRDPMNIHDLLTAGGNPIATASVVFRKSMLSELPAWFYTAPIGDWPLYVLLAQCGDIRYLDNVMAVHRSHGGGVWSGRSIVDNLHGHIILNHLFAVNLGTQYQDSVAAGLSRIYWRLSTAYANQGDIGNGKKYLKKSFSEYPFNKHIRISELTATAFRLYAPRFYRFVKRPIGGLNRHAT